MRPPCLPFNHTVLKIVVWWSGPLPFRLIFQLIFDSPQKIVNLAVSHLYSFNWCDAFALWLQGLNQPYWCYTQNKYHGSLVPWITDLTYCILIGGGNQELTTQNLPVCDYLCTHCSYSFHQFLSVQFNGVQQLNYIASQLIIIIIICCFCLIVLDEADRILDLGFAATLNAILENIPEERQTLLYSATQTRFGIFQVTVCEFNRM